MSEHELTSMIDEHIQLLAEARYERDHWMQSATDFSKALTEQQHENAALKARVAELEGALHGIKQNRRITQAMRAVHDGDDDLCPCVPCAVGRLLAAKPSTPTEDAQEDE